MKNPTAQYDILIIGAGPAGLSAAIAATRAGMRALIIDKGSIVDGIQRYQQEMFFFSTPELLEIGGIPFVVPTTRPTSRDCVNYYRSVADHYKLDFAFYERVVSLERANGGFLLTGASGRRYSGTYCVAATGYYDTPNMLNVPGESLPHISHFYRSPSPYYRQKVLVVGGKNSAVEAALDLWRHGAQVTLVHRGERLSSGVKYWILPDLENRIAAGSITAQFSSVVREFREGVTLIGGADGRESEVATDFAFVLIGYRPDVAFLRSLGIAIDADTLVPAHNPETYETNVPGLFVAGGLVGGRFNNKVFIENGREHGAKIVASLKR
jgi:thioredoxin reductase (NADPH)